MSVILTAVLSLWSLSFRYRVEEHNKAVAVLAEAETIDDLASAEGISFDFALAKLKAQGLNGLVLSEESVAGLMARQELELVAERNGRLAVGGDKVRVLERVERGIRIHRPDASLPITDYTESRGTLQVPFTRSQIRNVVIGLPPDFAASAKASGLIIVARYSNSPGNNPLSIERLLTWGKEQGAEFFLPLGDQVLGRRDNLKATNEALLKLGMAYCSPEFAKLGGDQNMLELNPKNVIRLHAAQSAELDKLPFSEAVDRYVRAARERNMRMLLLRPLTLAAEKPLAEFGKFVAAVNRGVVGEGLTLGKPHPFEDSQVPAWLFALVGLSVVPALCWTLAQLLGGWLCVAAQVVVAILGLACFKEQGRPYLALAGAILLPIFSFIVLERRVFKRTIPAFFSMAAICLVGGLLVAGLHNGVEYFVRANQFSGVKLAHFAPIGIIGLYFFWRMTSVGEVLKSAVTWNQALIAVVVLGALVLMASRTGNDNPAAVSGVEMKFRSLLDAILFVRPRTKEFLIGHPLLFVGVALLLRHYSGKPTWGTGWIALFLTSGAIGLTSIVNTMCHFHTPITLSLARIGVGLVAGCILGSVLWVFVGRRQPASEH